MLLPPDVAGSVPLKVDMLRVNSAGTMVAALCSSKDKSRDQRLFVHCFENLATLVYDFDKARVCTVVTCLTAANRHP
jgi:hypothetical protein